ncbi:MAG: hypothetical protein KC466_20015 [Myxococcales bacterium]|nr:hypothetical protein [Myxococcales bacterium]
MERNDRWRGDREDLAAFAGAFVTLQGDDAPPTQAQMRTMTDFVATLRYPPNPLRNLDGSVKNEVLPNGGNPSVGEALFTGPNLDGNRTCNACHALPTGTNTFINGPRTGEQQTFKVAQLRNAYEKTGFDLTSLDNNRGFGFLHDGTEPSVFHFLHRSVFNGFLPGPPGDQQRRDLEAFVFSLGTDTPPAVGTQVTVDATNKTDPQVLQLLNGMINLANGGQIGMVVKGLIGGQQRGAYYAGGGNFQLDRAAEILTSNQILAQAGAGGELTATAVVLGTEVRIGVDRDEDGKLDRDEIDAGTDPADPNS